MIPNLKDFVFKEIDEGVRYQCFIDVSFIFTFAGQWATEIKIKDIENRKEK